VTVLVLNQRPEAINLKRLEVAAEWNFGIFGHLTQGRMSLHDSKDVSRLLPAIYYRERGFRVDWI